MENDSDKLSEDAERLIQLLIGDGTGEQVSRLAREIVEKRESARRENKKAMLDELKGRLAKYEKDNVDDAFMEDGSLDQIWNNAVSANADAMKFQESLLSQWGSPYHKALANYRGAIELLCERWGFGKDVWAMLHFIFVEFGQYAPGNCTVSPGAFFDLDYDTSSVEGILFIGGKLSKKEVDWGGLDLKDVDGKSEHATEKAESGPNADSLHLARSRVFGEDVSGGDKIQTAICDAIYLCCHPDALCWLSDAEFALRVLTGFINGATKNDASVRYARLKMRINELEKEIAECTNVGHTSTKSFNHNTDEELELIIMHKH